MKKLLMVVTFILMASCAKEEFATPKNSNGFSTPQTETGAGTVGTSFTYVQPPVDLLFVWDNTSSSTFINNNTKAALNNVVNNISERFDYHVMLAPLVSSGGVNAGTYFFSKDGTSPGGGVQNISKHQASTVIGQFPPAGGTGEAGLQRINDLIKNNQSNGVFRDEAYTLIILMSNEDSSNWNTTGYSLPGNHPVAEEYMKGKVHDLLCMRGNYDGSFHSGAKNPTYNASCSGVGSYRLNSTMMRLISITAAAEPGSSSCPQVGDGEKNWIYRKASQSVLSTAYTNLTGGYPFIPASVTNGDQVDICNTSFRSLFSSVNSAIDDAIIAHKYNFIKIADPNKLVDPDTIVLTKSGVNIPEYTGSGSGFTYRGVMTNKDTRYEPTAGEPQTGHMIQLHGNARLTYPESIQYYYEAPKKFYGYVHLDAKPQLGSISLKINGSTISESSSNGWKLMMNGSEPQYFSNFNIRVVSESDTTPAYPSVIKSGYFLKLYGSAVYSDGANVEVNFYPTGE
ncbi:hypothetical protein [Halobacteriovorax sp. DPLXC-1]|uniref:hypothetical protein n=1 Tax=unclassified Halobacteriovorax TaxID=2639665 RepID=UPI002FF08AB4